MGQNFFVLTFLLNENGSLVHLCFTLEGIFVDVF